MIACMSQTEKLFPEIETLREDDDDRMSWRVDNKRRFVEEIVGADAFGARGVLFRCSGDLKTRQIDRIELGSKIKRPAAGESWSF